MFLEEGQIDTESWEASWFDHARPLVSFPAPPAAQE
jgi:hypothetical protein